MSKKTFYRWLKEQVGRDDSIGDFARDATHDSNFPKNLRHVGKHLELVGACDGGWSAFEKAVAEWRDHA